MKYLKLCLLGVLVVALGIELAPYLPGAFEYVVSNTPSFSYRFKGFWSEAADSLCYLVALIVVFSGISALTGTKI